VIHSEGGPELIIINLAIIYRLNRNFSSAYIDRFGYNLVTGDAEICFPPPGETQADTTLHVHECCSWHGRLKEMSQTGQADIGLMLLNIQCCQVSFALVKYCVIYNY
jgi:hypothetical protein